MVFEEEVGDGLALLIGGQYDDLIKNSRGIPQSLFSLRSRGES